MSIESANRSSSLPASLDFFASKKSPNKNQKVQGTKKSKTNAKKSKEAGSDEDLFADSMDMDVGDLAESSINGSQSNEEDQEDKVKNDSEDETKINREKRGKDIKLKKEEQETSENEKKAKKKLKKEEQETSEDEKKAKKKLKKEEQETSEDE